MKHIIVGTSVVTGNEVYWNGKAWTAFVMRVRIYEREPKPYVVERIAENSLGFILDVKSKPFSEA